ncbi:MAG: hypothetical protein KGR22_09970 [Planctomycetes bacterium]|nr:hypothetical protein [Planctomycetota bacterium]
MSALRTRRSVTALIGLALLSAAVWAVTRHRESAAAAWSTVRQPSLSWSIALPVTVLATVALTAKSLLWLTNRAARESRLGFGEMVGLTLASSLGNMIPIQPGLAGRVAYQLQVHGMPVAVSLLVTVQSTLLTLAAVAWLGVALLMIRAGGLSWSAAPASVLLITPALLASARGGSVVPSAFAARFGELLCSALRTTACFALVGHPIEPLVALTLACASNAANCVPMIGGGLGIREWITGLLAPALAGIATPDALAAELLNRAVELLVVVPGGLLAGPPLARRIAEAMRTRRVMPTADGAGTATPRSMLRWSFAIGSAQRPSEGESDPPPSTPTSSAP